MDMMEMRFRMMAMMGGGDMTQEIYKIDDDTLTSTTNIDTYFGSKIQGWYTEPIILVYKPILSTAYRKLTYIGSKYLFDNYSFTQIFRSDTNGSWSVATRNNYAINVSIGDEYIVIRGEMLE